MCAWVLPVCPILLDLAGEPDHMANIVILPGDGRVSACACLQAQWVTLTMWQIQQWSLWRTGANYVCVSQETQEVGSDHACLAHARLRGKLRCTSSTRRSSQLSEARPAMGQAQCHKLKHQGLVSCVFAYAADTGVNAPQTGLLLKLWNREYACSAKQPTRAGLCTHLRVCFLIASKLT